MTPTAVIGSYTAANSIDGSTHFLLIQPGGVSTAYEKINRNVFLGVTGQPMDISSTQTISNKVLNNTNLVTLLDGSFTLQNNVDTTKRAIFSVAGVTTSTTRTYTLPNASSTLVDLVSSQTLINKTFTSPAITGGSIDNSTITVDAISGHTVAGNGSVYGLSIHSGVIQTSGAGGSTLLQQNALQANQLAINAIKLGYAEITSSGTVASTARSALSNPLSVTVTVPAGGRDILITVFSGGVATSAAAGQTNTIAIMEGTTCLGQVVWEQPVATYREIVSFSARVSAPSAGSHTYTVQGATTSGTLTVNAGTANPTVTNYGPAYLLVTAI